MRGLKIDSKRFCTGAKIGELLQDWVEVFFRRIEI